MKHSVTPLFAAALLAAAGLAAAPAQAFHCPLLVKECRALVAKMEKREGADQGKVAEARAGCEEALKLHEAGNHKGAIVRAGQAITTAGEAAK